MPWSTGQSIRYTLFDGLNLGGGQVGQCQQTWLQPADAPIWCENITAPGVLDGTFSILLEVLAGTPTVNTSATWYTASLGAVATATLTAGTDNRPPVAPPAPGTVPEPTSLALLGIASVAAATTRHRVRAR